MTEIISNLAVTIDPTKSVSNLDKIISSFHRLTSVSDKSTKNIKRQFSTLNKGFELTKSVISNVTESITRVLTNLATQIAIIFGFSELVDATRRIEKFETTFLTFTGTLKLARKEINLLLGVTNMFGVSFEAAIIPFAKFAAATQDMAKSDIRGIFTSFIEASSALQLNMQEVNGVFLALQQIASKGRVSMEELRLQLAERIPGTMIIAANSMKMTMMQFEKAARTGTINVNEFLLAFAEGIHEKFGAAAELAADRLFAKMNRLSNALLFFKSRIFSTGQVSEAYSGILEDITNKLTDNDIATGALSDMLGKILGKLEQIIKSIKAEDINNWINSFVVFSKTIGITIDAVWNLGAALLNIFTLGTGSMALKLLRWPFDLAAAFDLARDGLLDFNDIMAASSFDELHTLVADVMLADQELQALRVTFGELEDQLSKLQSKMKLGEIISLSRSGLTAEIRETQDLLYVTGQLIEEKENLVGAEAMRMDPQLRSLTEQYDELTEILSKLHQKILRVREDGTLVSRGLFDFNLEDDIRQVQDQLHGIQLLIDKRKEYFGIKFDETGQEIDEPTKIIMPPSDIEFARAAKFIDRNNKLMQRGYDGLLSTHDRTIKRITDSYEDFHTQIQSFVSKDPNKLGVLTQEEADEYVREMEVFTNAMLAQVEKLGKIDVLCNFNFSLKEAKDKLLPDYEVELNKINEQFKTLTDLAEKAALLNNWDTKKIKAVKNEINELKDAIISLSVTKVLDKFNSSLKKAKDKLLPEYELELNEINEQFKTLTDLAKRAEIVAKWDTEKIKEVKNEIDKLKEATISLSTVKILDNFNSTLKEAKDKLLPDYTVELNEINEQFKTLTDLAEKAAIAGEWDIEKIKSVTNEIKELKEATISLCEVDLSPMEQAYMDLYTKMGVLTQPVYDLLKAQYEQDRIKFIELTGDKVTAYQVFIDQVNNLNEAMKKSNKHLEKDSQSCFEGIKSGLDTYAKNALDITSQIENAVTGIFKNMENAMVDFCMTGKIDFADFANSIIRDMLRIYIQSQITGIFAGGLGGLFGGGLGGDTSGSYMEVAKGGVFNSPSLSTYSNSVVDTPTFFSFAQGAGVFGEAGPEAIMPLTRLPSGDLGVKTESNDNVKSRRPMEVHIHESSGTQTRTEMSDDGMTLDVVIEQIEQKMAGRMNRGTGLAPFMDSRYSRTY